MGRNKIRGNATPNSPNSLGVIAGRAKQFSAACFGEDGPSWQGASAASWGRGNMQRC
jgi:hypothetical protein